MSNRTLLLALIACLAAGTVLAVIVAVQDGSPAVLLTVAAKVLGITAGVLGHVLWASRSPQQP